jgi:hypothetical protein
VCAGFADVKNSVLAEQFELSRAGPFSGCVVLAFFVLAALSGGAACVWHCPFQRLAPLVLLRCAPLLLLPLLPPVRLTQLVLPSRLLSLLSADALSAAASVEVV